MPRSLGIGGSFALVQPRNVPNTLVFSKHNLVDCYLTNTSQNRPSNDDIIQAFVDGSAGYECDVIACMVWYANGKLYMKHLTLTMFSNLIINRAYPVEFEVNAPADDEDCTWILQQFVSLDPRNHCATIECTWTYTSNCVVKKYTNLNEYGSYDNIFDAVISVEKAGSSDLVKEDKVGGMTCNILSEQVNEIYRLIANHWNVEGSTPELQLKCYFSYDKFGSLFFKWCDVGAVGALEAHVESGDPGAFPVYKYSQPKVLSKSKNNLLMKATFSVIALPMIELKDMMQNVYGVKNITIGTNSVNKLQKFIQINYDGSVISYQELLQQVWTYISRVKTSTLAEPNAAVSIHYHNEEQKQQAQQFHDEISAILVEIPVQFSIDRLSVLINFSNDDLLSEVSDIISYDQDVAINTNNDKLLSNIEGWQSAWLSAEAVNTSSTGNSVFNPKPPSSITSAKGGRSAVRKQPTASYYKQSLENPYGLKNDFYVLTDREKFLLHEGDVQGCQQGSNKIKENAIVDLEKLGELSKPRVAPLTAFIDDRLANYNIDSSSSRVNTPKSSKPPGSANSNKPSVAHKRYYKKTMPGPTSTFKIQRSKPKTYIQLLFGGQIESAPKIIRAKFKPFKRAKPLLLPEWVEPELHPKNILVYPDDDDLSVHASSRKSISRPSSSYSRGREALQPETALQPSRPTSSRSINQSINSNSRNVKTKTDSEVSDNLEDSAHTSRSKVAVVKRAKTPPIQPSKLRIGQAMARKLEVDHSQYHVDVELHDRLITNTPKSIPCPNGLADDILVVINRMTSAVTNTLMANIKGARKVAIDHHNSLLTELSGNVSLTHERTLSAEKMRNIVELVTSGYFYDKHIKFTTKKSKENYKKLTDLYSEMSVSERHLISLLQLLSCVPNHRPVDNMVTVILWLLSAGRKGCSETSGADSSGIVTSLEQPIEENHPKLLKNASRFVRSCQNKIKAINEIENQRGADLDKASIRRKDKFVEELKAWYNCKDVGKDYECIINRYNKLHQESVVTAGGAHSVGMEQVSISASISSPASKSHSSVGVSSMKAMKKYPGDVVSASDDIDGSDDDNSSTDMIPSTYGITTKFKDKLKAHLGMEAFIRSFNTLKQAIHVRKMKDVSNNLQPIVSRSKGKEYLMSICEVASTSVNNNTELLCKPCNAAMPVIGTGDEAQDDDSLLGFNTLQEESLEIHGEYIHETDDDFSLGDEDDIDLQLLENTLNNAVQGINNQHKIVNNNVEDAKVELDSELLFHKLAPNITMVQRNMLLLSIVSDTNRTILLCISVLLKYLSAGRDIVYDDIVNLLCTPVARAIGRKNLEDLLTWLRVNRKVGINFNPTASLSRTEMAIEKISSFWPVLNVAVFAAQDNENDSNKQDPATSTSVCTVRLEWLERQKIIKLFGAPNTFQPNLNNI